MKNLLIELDACEEAREWAGDKTAEQIINECHRGDWLLWLAQKVDLDFRLLTLAKGKCANTVRHLMKDERSIKAVDTIIAFGEGKATRDELNDVAYVADTADAAYIAATVYAIDAVDAADAAAYAAFVYATVDATVDACANLNNRADARKQNQLQTADICREVFGKQLLEILNNKVK